MAIIFEQAVALEPLDEALIGLAEAADASDLQLTPRRIAEMAGACVYLGRPTGPGRLGGALATLAEAARSSRAPLTREELEARAEEHHANFRQHGAYMTLPYGGYPGTWRIPSPELLKHHYGSGYNDEAERNRVISRSERLVQSYEKHLSELQAGKSPENAKKIKEIETILPQARRAAEEAKSIKVKGLLRRRENYRRDNEHETGVLVGAVSRR